MAVFNEPLSNVFKATFSRKEGLSESEATASRERFGSNGLEKKKGDSTLKRFFAQFKNLMVIVLLVSALISVIVALSTGAYEDLFEGGLIFVIVILNAIIGVVQEKRADNAIALLNKKTEPFAKVYRGGLLKQIPLEEVVVGDRVVIRSGDFVPADIRLTSAVNLKCDESTLTGESQAVYKNADALLTENTPIAEQETMCFSGTTCTFGNGEGVVVRVGKNTEMGKIAGMLSHEIKEKTPLEKNIDKIGKFITYAVLVIVAIVFVFELIFSREISFLNAFLIAVALAVAAIPESLPAVITIVMALGVERLARRGAIVKTLSSVETLGCCNVICSDKTGTLTENKMTVKHIYFNGALSCDFSKGTYAPLYACMSLCNNAKIGSDGNVIGDATETSLLRHTMKHFADFENLSKSRRLFEIPFDSTRKIMSTINKTPEGNFMFSKGAYDYLIGRCTSILVGGKIVPLSSAERKNIDAAIAKMGQNAERVLAFTMKAAKADYKTEAEADLTFIGLVGIVDPPRKEAKKAIRSCFDAGLKPVMITGDHPETAFAIAKELGLAKNKRQVITGQELDKMSPRELAKNIDAFSVFARVSPEHKVKIVEAFKASGKIVAMTGDGVNDAPSIKRANIGVCMGITGTDVTKSVADLIITDDDFSTIVVAIKQGRTIYSNIQKIIQFLMSTNAVEVLGIFVATLVMRNSIFLLPSQILFINLVTDSLPAFALGLEKPEKGIMERPPREPKETIFSGRTGTSILYQSFVQTLLVLVVFVVAVNKWGNDVASTMVFLIICLMQIIHAVNCKTNDSIFKINIFNNPSFNLSFLALFALIMVVALVPFLNTAFGIVALSGTQWLIVALSSMSIIPLVEICKFFVNLDYKKQKSKKNHG